MLEITDGGAVRVAENTRVSFGAGSSREIHFSAGTLMTGSLFAAVEDLSGMGLIETHGLVSDIDLLFNATYGLNQTFNLNGLPGQDVTVNLSVNSTGVFDSIGAGYAGTTTIDESVTVASKYGYVGYGTGSTGRVNVVGAGSTWSNSGALYVVGELSVTSGGVVSNSQANINFSGQVKIDGAGSTWTNAGISIGASGPGTLLITGGGTVISGGSALGLNRGDTGQIIVDGVGSTYTDGFMYAGHFGTAKISVTNGGVANLSNVLLARRPGTASQIVVDGPGSTFSISGTSPSMIGVGGAGTMTITGRGLVSNAGTFTIDYDNSGNDSFVNMATGGVLAIAGDTHLSITQFLSTFGGTKAIRYWNNSTNNWANITQATLGVDYTLVYRTTGSLAGYTLLTVGTYPTLPGDFNDDGVVDAADYIVWRTALGGTVLKNDTSPGTVDQSDQLVWRAHFGSALSIASGVSTEQAVPEPTALLLLFSAMALATGRRVRMRP